MEKLRFALGESTKSLPTVCKMPAMSDYKDLSDRDLLVRINYQVDYMGAKLNEHLSEWAKYKEVQALASLAIVERVTALEGHILKKQHISQANSVWIAVRGHILRNTNPALKALKLNSGDEVEAFFASEERCKAAAIYILSTLPWNTFFPRLLVELLVTEEYRKAASWSGPACK